jgi:hypothetical protein
MHIYTYVYIYIHIYILIHIYIYTYSNTCKYIGGNRGNSIFKRSVISSNITRQFSQKKDKKHKFQEGLMKVHMYI